MAVELRCPDCRAKLKLGEAPEAGTEVECPKCGTVFPAPEPEAAADEDAPKKKKKPASDDDDADEKPKKDSDEKKEKKPKKKAKGKDAGGPNAPKRRKAKKKETSNVALFAVIGLGVLMLCGVAGTLVWFFARTPKSVEMMTYLPEDCDTVAGLNLGHAQKYPEMYKNLSATFKDAEFKAAADALAKVLGAADGDALIDYVVFGMSKGGVVVIRSKFDFDQSAVSKLPGAETKTMGGSTYYLVSPFKGAAKVRVFAPTSRLIVYCTASTAELPDATFQKMLTGNAGSKDNTIGVRAGPLGKRVTTGTFWVMTVYNDKYKPPAAPPSDPNNTGNDDGAAQLARMMGETLSGAQGQGFKASVGSREVRFEWVVWSSDGDKASSIKKKFKESELGKGDEGTPPRWWKDNIENIGNKKIAAQLLANIGFGSSGELFYLRSSVESADLKDAVSSMAGKATGGAPGAPPPPPKPRRRRFLTVRAGARR